MPVPMALRPFPMLGIGTVLRIEYPELYGAPCHATGLVEMLRTAGDMYRTVGGRQFYRITGRTRS